jgi:hypothetical protein
MISVAHRYHATANLLIINRNLSIIYLNDKIYFLIGIVTEMHNIFHLSLEILKVGWKYKFYNQTNVFRAENLFSRLISSQSQKRKCRSTMFMDELENGLSILELLLLATNPEAIRLGRHGHFNTELIRRGETYLSLQ